MFVSASFFPVEDAIAALHQFPVTTEGEPLWLAVTLPCRYIPNSKLIAEKSPGGTTTRFSSFAPLPMPITELDDDGDEDWYDEEPDDCEDESAPCPECSETVSVITDKCPACGYWFSAADRRAVYASESKPMWLKLTAVVVLIALLAGMFGLVVGVF